MPEEEVARGGTARGEPGVTRIVLNGREVEVDPKQPLIRACHDHGVDVPMYCYHPGLHPVGSCRICQVEVRQGEMPPRVVAACRTPVSEGMVVDTEAAGAHRARRQCLEFLLKNHPLDCPICDKAGECDLQDFAYREGQSEGRSVEPRRKLEKRKSLGDVILLDQERCILCSRCVRFFSDVTGKAQLTVAGLGSHSVITTFMDRPLEGNYQGNLADVCPVGALTLKEFRFQARVWNLQKQFSTCGECSRGCSITVEVLRNREVKRMRPRYNPEVNDWWMCDSGRFSYHRYNEADRLTGGRILSSGRLEEVGADEVLDELALLLRYHGPTLIVVSPWLTVEEGEALQAVADAAGAEVLLIDPPPSELADDLLHTSEVGPNRRGLGELGFSPTPPGDIVERMAASPCAFLVGERSAELLGAEALASLPSKLRLAQLDTDLAESPALVAAMGVPNAVEREGTWINIDGHRGRIAPARPAPAGVPALTQTLAGLAERLSAQGVQA